MPRWIATGRGVCVCDEPDEQRDTDLFTHLLDLVDEAEERVSEVRLKRVFVLHLCIYLLGLLRRDQYCYVYVPALYAPVCPAYALAGSDVARMHSP